ncbi:uncharacterized protein LOC135394814 [Ornithodoros turicata]|uniref:uncharacterized protein LOC135394814 n=1 Tax=Ornithodoros turicata TaxID=34597 RepID=UPI00313880B4
MRIESVTLQSYLSFRHETTVGPFSKGLNVLIGLNGSGKSNILHALTDVLNDASISTQPSGRRYLLHNGEARASITVVINNEDQRIQGSKFITLKREISPVTNKFYIEKKLVEKEKIRDLLSTVGMAQEINHHIISQGQILSMTLVSPEERMLQLKTFLGLDKFEYAITTGNSWLNDAIHAREKLREEVARQTRALEAQSTELEQVKRRGILEQKDRTISCIQYRREQAKLKKKLQEAREKLQRQSSEEEQELRTIRNRRTLLEHEIELEADRERLDQVRWEQDMEQGEEIARQIQRTRCRGQELEEEVDKMETEINLKSNRLVEMTSKAQEIDDELLKLQQKIDGREQTTAELLNETKASEQKKGATIGAHSRANMNPEERNTFLRNRLAWIRETCHRKQNELDDHTRAISQAQEELARAQQELTRGKAEQEHLNRFIYQFHQEVMDLKKQKRKTIEDITDLERQRAVKSQVERNSQVHVREACSKLARVMGKGACQGWQGIEKVVRDLRTTHGDDHPLVKSYHGPLVKYLEVDENYEVPVNVVMGSRMFKLIVDTDTAATGLLKIFNQKKMPGWVEFCALNRHMKPPEELDVPEQLTQDLIPLTSCVRSAAIARDFAESLLVRKFLCRTMQLAAHARKILRGATLITPEGDRLDPRGAMTGGFIDTTKLGTSLFRTYKEVSDAYSALVSEGNALDQRIKDLRALQEEVDRRIERINRKLEHHINSVADNKHKIAAFEREIATFQELVDGKREAVKVLQDEVQLLRREEVLMVDEQHNPPQAGLSEQELEELGELEHRIRDMRRRFREENKLLQELKAARSSKALEKRYHSRTLEELNQEIEELKESHDLKQAEIEESARHFSMMKRKRRISNVDQPRPVSEKLKDLKEELHLLLELEQRKKAERSESQAEQDACRQLMASLEEQIAHYQRLINKCGAPSSFYSEYDKMETSRVRQIQKELRAQLERYTHLNLRVMRDYDRKVRARDDAARRLADLDTSEQPIKNARDSLQENRVEAVTLNIKQVCAYFEQIFKRFVPQGRAKAVISVDHTSQEEGQTQVDRMVRLELKASFLEHGEFMDMRHLSGGQKSVVQLCYTLALQKADMSPFFLFDEVDAALSGRHCATLAEIVKEASETAQFICATFKPELVNVAENVFYVYNKHGATHLRKLTHEEAMSFITASSRRQMHIASGLAALSPPRDLQEALEQDSQLTTSIRTRQSLSSSGLEDDDASPARTPQRQTS